MHSDRLERGEIESAENAGSLCVVSDDKGEDWREFLKDSVEGSSVVGATLNRDHSMLMQSFFDVLVELNRIEPPQ